MIQEKRMVAAIEEVSGKGGRFVSEVIGAINYFS